MITDALIDAQKKTIPNKITQLRGPKWKASSPVEELLKKCKILYTSWCKIGKPKNHNLHKQLKTEKRNLRRQQRVEYAIDRIMDRIEELSIELCYRLYVRRLQCTQET
jgi:hypothetical protein